MQHRGVLFDRLFDIQHRRQRLITNIDPLARVFGGRAAGRQHDGHRFTGVENFVDRDWIVIRILLVLNKAHRYWQWSVEFRFQVLPREDREHTIGFPGSPSLDTEDPGVRLSRAHHIFVADHYALRFPS